MFKKKHYEVISPDGTTCPRCGEVAETREHSAITQKQLGQPFYFKRWYNCTNQVCKTAIFMRDDWKVWNLNAAAREMKEKEEYLAQLDFLRSL